MNFPLRLNLLGWIFLCIATTCAAMSGFCLFVEIGEINRKLPESEQISYIGIHPAKMADIKEHYERLCPSGYADTWRVVFQIAMFVFLGLTAIAAGAFH
jgi:hypothetical protein